MHNESSNSILVRLRAQMTISTMYERKIDRLCLDAARSKMEAERRMDFQKKRINLDLQLMSNTIDMECMHATERMRLLALSARNDTREIERIEDRMARDKNSLLFFKRLHDHGFVYPERKIIAESEESELDMESEWLSLIYQMCFLYGIGIMIHEKFQR